MWSGLAENKILNTTETTLHSVGRWMDRQIKIAEAVYLYNKRQIGIKCKEYQLINYINLDLLSIYEFFLYQRQPF